MPNFKITLDAESLLIIQKYCGDTPAIRMLKQSNWDIDPRETNDVYDGIEKSILDICELIKIIGKQDGLQTQSKQNSIITATSCLKILCERIGKYRNG